MKREHPELHTGDWVDVFCRVCLRHIDDGEWRDEDEHGTTCTECYERQLQVEDSPAGHLPGIGRSRAPSPD